MGVGREEFFDEGKRIVGFECDCDGRVELCGGEHVALSSVSIETRLPKSYRDEEIEQSKGENVEASARIELLEA